MRCQIGPALWSDKGLGLPLKGTAWLAGFPVTNMVIEFPDIGRDYVGPSIDLGFRLAGRATRKKFVISADLALMLVDAVRALRMSEDDFPIHFSGRESFKGISNEYPVFWIDCADQTSKSEASLSRCDYKYISEFVEEFITANSPPFYLPFIVSDEHPPLQRDS